MGRRRRPWLLFVVAPPVLVWVVEVLDVLPAVPLPVLIDVDDPVPPATVIVASGACSARAWPRGCGRGPGHLPELALAFAGAVGGQAVPGVADACDSGVAGAGGAAGGTVGVAWRGVIPAPYFGGVVSGLAIFRPPPPPVSPCNVAPATPSESDRRERGRATRDERAADAVRAT